MEQLQQRKQLLDHATKYDVILTTYKLAKTPALLYFFQRTRSLPGPGQWALDQEPQDADFHSDAQDSFRKFTLTDGNPAPKQLGGAVVTDEFSLQDRPEKDCLCLLVGDGRDGQRTDDPTGQKEAIAQNGESRFAFEHNHIS